jgi:hypothetical protein
MKADRGWQRPFHDPIPLPRGRQLVTLKDAGTYITKPSKADHATPERQAAMESLILVAERGGPGNGANATSGLSWRHHVGHPRRRFRASCPPVDRGRRKGHLPENRASPMDG